MTQIGTSCYHLLLYSGQGIQFNDSYRKWENINHIYEKLANIILSISRGIAIYGTKNKIHLKSKRYKNNFYGEYCGL